MEESIREALTGGGSIADTAPFAEASGFAHGELIGICKSLQSGLFISSEGLSSSRLQLSEEGEESVAQGSPEARVFGLVPADGIGQEELMAAAGKAGKVGMAKAMQAKWLAVVKVEGSKAKRVERLVPSISDGVAAQLQAVLAAGGAEGCLPAADFAVLKKRGLVSLVTVKSLRLSAGPAFGTWGVKAVADLTHEMLVKGTWKDTTFKPINLEAAGKSPAGGALHPLMKVRTLFREIFLEMGFEEMKTNKFVESSFWNFDALFQPQQHPARDEHDTFFIKSPATTLHCPPEYLARVKATHEDGGAGLGPEYGSDSVGWRYNWSEDVTRTNLLRTHTTAVSSRTLYALAQHMKATGKPVTPQKYFSIDRVFRNESLDATHLAEFHQVEGH